MAKSANFEIEQTTRTDTEVLLCVHSMAPEALEPFLRRLHEVLAGSSVTVALPEAGDGTLPSTPFHIIQYKPAATAATEWTLTAADYLNAYELAQECKAETVLLLGAEAQSLEPEALQRMIRSATQERCDLVLPRYALPARAGLVNSAILYPISRALFGAVPRFPLAIDLCFSARMGARLGAAAQRLSGPNYGEGLVWAVAEATVAGFSIAEVDVGTRELPPPSGQDLNSVLAQVTGSLFADVDAKAAFWQRARVARMRPVSEPTDAGVETPADEIRSMVEGFRMAYGNLAEIWSLVLPPQSLLGLKRLSAVPAESFVMADALWARIVYDFLLAYRLRTMNRGHLLGALTPLYLAWVASHLVQTAETRAFERHIESVAAAFEAEKPYLVSRWRWPDRFNP
ncbi:hypothetical protein GOB94_00095 [Granulicella sp. 5B5]|uniref:hypothetical protein n=1 Tax=Granulicella sp. 5B5 TaxID=1617967 RepID=UPI0015F6BE29|nr:hypothetical protein [Granulicella sp. 5B5]QMV17284.1 hypothetical protein GOB94_00095 [Granulicella sp. 5B5]